MGTDMTTFIEIWDDNDKEWRFFHKVVSCRNYVAFGRIGGVRGDCYGNDKFHNRGIPHHLSPEVERELKQRGNYYHSITYYSGKDLMETVIDHTIEDTPYLCSITITFDTIMGAYETTGLWDFMMNALLEKVGPTNVRFIFAFDN